MCIMMLTISFLPLIGDIETWCQTVETSFWIAPVAWAMHELGFIPRLRCVLMNERTHATIGYQHIFGPLFWHYDFGTILIMWTFQNGSTSH